MTSKNYVKMLHQLYITIPRSVWETFVFRCQSIAVYHSKMFWIPYIQVPSASSSEILHFITKKDLQNISHTFGVHRHQTLHKNDADSVAAWVEHTRQQTSTQNLVRYIKHQGDQSHYKLKDEEFVRLLPVMHSLEERNSSVVQVVSCAWTRRME